MLGCINKQLTMNPQAEELNVIIREQNPAVFEMLSERGRAIFFPKKGILGQTAQAKGKKINATIGAAMEDDGSIMNMNCLSSQMNIAPASAFPYAPSFGRPDIRSKWKEMLYQKNPSLNGIELSLPVVTNALTHALSICGYMFMNEGDSVLVSDLFWGNYNLTFNQAYGTKYAKYTLFDGDGFNLKSFEENLSSMPAGRKIILLNFPNNPTGYTPTPTEIESIISILKTDADKGNQIVVLCDDAYFGLVYEDGIYEESIFAPLSTAHENILAVKVDGPTKEDYVWGFRVGFITYGIKGGTPELYEAVAAKTAGAIRGNISNACNVTQSMLLNAFNAENYSAEKAEKGAMLKQRYNAVKAAVKNEKYAEYFTPYPFNSGYFMCVQPKEGIDGEALRALLLEKYSTGVINMAGTIRVAFSAVGADLIPELFENIYNACKELS